MPRPDLSEVAVPGPPTPYYLFTPEAYAVCDAYAAEPRTFNRAQKAGYELVFLSFTGTAQQVQIIRNSINHHRDLKIQPVDHRMPELPGRGVFGTAQLDVRPFSRSRLDSAPGQPRLEHLIYGTHFLNDARPGPNEYVYAASAEDGVAAYYRHFSQRTKIPTLDHWAPDIWEMAHAQGMIQKLPSSPDLHVWQCRFDDEKLRLLIAAAVARGELTID